MQKRERNQAIIKAARAHISGCVGIAEPSDAHECWNVADLPKVRGATSDEIRARLSTEIERQLTRK